MTLNKSFIIKKLNEQLKVETNDTRINAYLRAIKNIRNYDKPLNDFKDLDNIKGIGPFFKKKINEFYEDGEDDYKSLIIEKLSILRDLELKNKYKCNLNFEYYSYNDNAGFYIKMDKVSPTTYNTSKDSRKVININN